MVVHVCCKLLLLIFHLFFQTYVASVFIWMLYMFHTYVASVLSRYRVCLQWFSSVFSRVFASVSDTCFKCFIFLLLYVVSIASGCFKSRSDVSHGMRVKSERGRERSPHRRMAQARFERHGPRVGA